MERIDTNLLRPAHQRPPLALIVDDDAVGRIALRKLLANCGYESVLAKNGAEGLERFSEVQPDIVFMDMQMHVMDGLEATLHIKQRCGDHFVPVIFVTGNSGDDDLERCIDAGGDDFLVKPYNRKALAAKIRAMERISALHRRNLAMHAVMQDEQVLAKSILEGAVMGANVRPPALAVHLNPATTFNGDILLTAYAPTGDLHVMLGDFTGHGLAATVGALPVAETFRAMTHKGFSPARILTEINRKLRAILPTGIFLAAVFVRVDRALGRIAVINCGMPDTLIFSEGTVSNLLPSVGLPLAVIDDANFDAAEVVVPVSRGSHVFLVSDGCLEATNPDGAIMGSDRMIAAIGSGLATGQGGLASALKAIDSFRSGIPLADDASLIELHLVDALFSSLSDGPVGASAPAAANFSRHQDASGWRLAVELRGHALRETNPVPLLMSLLKEFPGAANQAPALFTVLAELYNNALDHGVLNLDSRLKTVDFTTYLAAREEGLNALGDACVTVEIDCEYGDDNGTMEIKVKDSGNGFQPDEVMAARDDQPHGRGLALVRGLCKSLHFEPPGNRAYATYAWDRRGDSPAA